MKRCVSSGDDPEFARKRVRTFPSPSASVNLPISAVAAAGPLPHIPRARGGGRSPSLQGTNERGQTQRVTLKHLFGITDCPPSGTASHENSIRRMPPFKITGVTDGGPPRLSVGVIRKVVTSWSALDSHASMPAARAAGDSTISTHPQTFSFTLFPRVFMPASFRPPVDRECRS